MSLLEQRLFSICKAMMKSLTKGFGIAEKVNTFGILHHNDALRDDVYGWCDEKGNIRIAFKDRQTGNYFRLERIVKTVAHEMAHLTHLDHGKEFDKLFRMYYNYLKREYL